ncbi:MAG: NifB/NifX family molybdenum-iron cluster-binding protein [Bacteroidota bacterium]
MTQIIAVPTRDGVLDGHFGHCPNFTLFEIKDGSITKEYVVDAPPHQPGLLPPWLANQNVTDVIAGGMGQRAIQLFNQNKVNVFVGAPQLPAREVVEGFLTESIAFTSNYCDH